MVIMAHWMCKIPYIFQPGPSRYNRRRDEERKVERKIEGIK
jgi:hypothetical protein